MKLFINATRKTGFRYAFLGTGVHTYTYEGTWEMQACFKFTSEYFTWEYRTKVVYWVRTYLTMILNYLKAILQ